MVGLDVHPKYTPLKTNMDAPKLCFGKGDSFVKMTIFDIYVRKICGVTQITLPETNVAPENRPPQ